MGNCSSCGAQWSKADASSSLNNGAAPTRDKSKSGRCCGKVSTPSIRPISRSASDILLPANLKCFALSDLKLATRNFRPDSILGHGGFGSVFKGWVDEGSLMATKPGTGKVIAVKRLNQEGCQGHREWLAEITYLGELEHPNLVKLVGYCLEDEHRLLVYEFMPRGSLENHLFRRGSHFQPLSWDLRMKIALGSARGLAFLHSSVPKVIYRDFKTSNVLLDLDFNAKLSDFGLAKDGPSGDSSYVSTRVMGTQGYAAPEYIATGHLSAKSDVYSFGVVLLEMLCGKRALDINRPTAEHNLVEWARPCLGDRQKLFRVLDGRMQGKFPIRGVERASLLALKCLSFEPKNRPRMSEVVRVLEQLQDEKDSVMDPAAEFNGNKNSVRASIARNQRNLKESMFKANAASLRSSSAPMHK